MVIILLLALLILLVLIQTGIAIIYALSLKELKIFTHNHLLKIEHIIKSYDIKNDDVSESVETPVILEDNTTEVNEEPEIAIEPLSTLDEIYNTLSNVSDEYKEYAEPDSELAFKQLIKEFTQNENDTFINEIPETQTEISGN